MDAVELINGREALWQGVGGWLWPVLVAPFVGSFLGVLIARLPAGRSVVLGRSVCPACDHALGARDLVPIASFVVLRGRCRFCARPIERFHLWVELSALTIALWAAAAGQSGAVLWAGCLLGWTLLALAWIDAVCLRLPDVLTLPLILAGLAEAALLEPDVLTGRAVGAAAAYAGLRLLAWTYRRFRGREGLGQGDAKLLAAAGAWVGGALLPDVLLGAALAGLAWAVRRGRPNPGERVPFGPFIAVSAWLVWLYF